MRAIALLICLAVPLSCFVEATEPDGSNSNAAYVWGNCATTKAWKGDFNDAIADVSREILLLPKNGDPYFQRGNYKQLSGDIKGAITDYRKCLELAIEPKYLVEERFQLWICESKIGLKTVANHSFSKYLKNLGSPWGDWQLTIGKFLLSQSTESDFLASAQSADKVVSAERLYQAWYYAGIKRLLDGDQPTAFDYFRKCTSAPPNNSIEYFMASGELRRRDR